VEGRPPEESELVERAARGDVDAYRQVMELHQGIAFRMAYLVAGDAGDAEDAVQDGFTKAWYALGRFRRGAPFRPWLLEIVCNEARNRRRSAGRRARLALRTAAEARPGEAAPSPEAAVLDGERRQALLDAVEELREEERLVVSCRYFLELSEAETATTLGIPTGTVKSRLARALEHLRERMEVTA
jgi:RNA polymerase sigma-70 factor (ECF subfamily)